MRYHSTRPTRGSSGASTLRVGRNGRQDLYARQSLRSAFYRTLINSRTGVLGLSVLRRCWGANSGRIERYRTGPRRSSGQPSYARSGR